MVGSDPTRNRSNHAPDDADDDDGDPSVGVGVAPTIVPYLCPAVLLLTITIVSTATLRNNSVFLTYRYTKI
jgi:hypothetical protein